jgi:hypothetical protein
MFCPKCSQSQTSDEIRYCSRCGFPLGTVAALLSNNGVLPAMGSPDQPSIRSRVATESLILTILSWAVAMACTHWFDASGIFEGIAKIGAFTFFMLGFIGLFRFLYAFLFLKIHPVARAKETPSVTQQTYSQLPPAQVSPISDWPRRQNTREMVSKHSVTENTTRLLDETDQ